MATIASLLFGACSDSDEERVLRSRNYEIRQNMSRLPTGLPEVFAYPDARPLMSGNYDPGAFMRHPEGAVVLFSDDAAEEIIAHYEQIFSKEGWSVIQSVQREEEQLLMGESSLQKLITIIVRPARLQPELLRSAAGAESLIKIYFRRPGPDA